jgi:hypothetical protein
MCFNWPQLEVKYKPTILSRRAGGSNGKLAPAGALLFAYGTYGTKSFWGRGKKWSSARRMTFV